MDKLNFLYARFSFRLSSDKRMALYRKLASLLSNDFTLMDALARIEKIESKDGRKPDEPFAIAMRDWLSKLERGASFADATRGWVPQNETLMLTLGDVSKLSIALNNVIRVGEGVAKIRIAMLAAVSYPLFLLALTVAIIIMVGIYLVPPLADAAGGDMHWTGVAATLAWTADFAAAYWIWAVVGFVGLVLIVWFSLANWTGRMRTLFDNLPPWSMYKVFVSVGWLMSLAAIVASDGNMVAAIKSLSDNGTKYLRSVTDPALKLIANGDNLGRALNNSGKHFPSDEIIGDLAIYADMNGFDQNLLKIATNYLDDSVRKMEKISASANSIGILIVSAVIGWVVFGTFQMQEQITNALS